MMNDKDMMVLKNAILDEFEGDCSMGSNKLERIAGYRKCTLDDLEYFAEGRFENIKRGYIQLEFGKQFMAWLGV